MLIQEYLEGTEYVVDGASRDGVFKCITLLWKYHKEAINGHSGSLRSLTSVYVAVVQEQQYLPAPSPPPSQWGGLWKHKPLNFLPPPSLYLLPQTDEIY